MLNFTVSNVNKVLIGFSLSFLCISCPKAAPERERYFSTQPGWGWFGVLIYQLGRNMELNSKPNIWVLQHNSKLLGRQNVYSKWKLDTFVKQAMMQMHLYLFPLMKQWGPQKP